jgi:hypothetical protein
VDFQVGELRAPGLVVVGFSCKFVEYFDEVAEARMTASKDVMVVVYTVDLQIYATDLAEGILVRLFIDCAKRLKQTKGAPRARSLHPMRIASDLEVECVFPVKDASDFARHGRVYEDEW